MNRNLEFDDFDKCVGPKRQVMTPPYILAWKATNYIGEVNKHMALIMINDISVIGAMNEVMFNQNGMDQFSIPVTEVALQNGSTISIAHEFNEVLSAVNEAIQSECPINLTGESNS